MNSKDLAATPTVSPEEPGSAIPHDPRRKLIFKQTLHLSIANVASQGARFLKNFILAGLLGPVYFGLWNGLQVFLIYGTNAHLGVLHAMAREIPMSRGAGMDEKIPTLASTGLTVSLLTSIAAAVLITAAVLLSMGAQAELLTILLLLPVLISQQVFLFYQFLLRADDEFGSLSRVLAITAVLELLVSLAFVYLFGFNGVLLGLIAGQGIGILIAFVSKRRVRLRFEIDYTMMRSLLQTGFPIMLTVLGYYLLTTIDRLLIITIAGSETLGYYALGSLAITALAYVPITINQVMYPKFAERFGSTQDPAALSGYLRIPTLATAHTMGFLLGAVIIGLPLVELLLPKYAPGIPAARILLAGSYFLSLPGSSVSFLLTIGRQTQYLVFLAGAIALGALLDVTVLSFGWGIEGVAAVTGFVYLAHSMISIQSTISRHSSPNSNPFGPFLGKLFLPCALAGGLVLVVTHVRLGHVLADVGAQIMLFSAVYASVSLWILRREKLW